MYISLQKSTGNQVFVDKN